MSKAFGGSRALDDVDFEVREGEIHALLGENGAGKSTLIKILAGVYRADTGTVRFRGVDADLMGRAMSLSVSFVHQELGLVDAMTVAENIALVSGYPNHRGLISWRAVGTNARRIMETMGVNLDARIVQWGQKHAISSLPLGTFEDENGPPSYHLAHAADVTVLLFVKEKVAANFAFRKGELSDDRITEVMKALPRIVQKK